MSDTSGPTSCEPFAKWDHDSQSWKTSEATSLWALTLSSLTLPAWGGLHNGELCEHPTPELAISVLDSSSLPTPNARDGKGSPSAAWSGQASLPRSVQMLPTPTTEHASGGYNPAWGHGMTLLDAAKVIVGAPAGPTTLLPTPAVNDMGEGKTLEWWDDWAPRQKSSDGRPAPHGRSLAIEAMRLLPTPLAEMGNLQRDDFTPNLRTVIEGNRLLPGAIMAPSSPDGNTSSDDPHQHQLSLDVQGIPA